MRLKSIALSIAIGAAAASACSHAAPAQDASTPEPVSRYSGEIVLNKVVDDAVSDATMAPGIRISFIGAEHAGKDATRWRLGRVRFVYAWESRGDANARYQQWRDAMDPGVPPYNALNRVTWTSALTTPEGFATLPEPADPANAGLLHILLQEPGWDSYPFPGAVHPAALQDAQVFELPDGARRVTVWLLRMRETSP